MKPSDEERRFRTGRWTTRFCSKDQLGQGFSQNFGPNEFMHRSGSVCAFEDEADSDVPVIPLASVFTPNLGNGTGRVPSSSAYSMVDATGQLAEGVSDSANPFGYISEHGCLRNWLGGTLPGPDGDLQTCLP
jgi:hypothetical protein